jgi:hypothetical protein
MLENYSQYFNKAIQVKSNTELLMKQYEQAKLDKEKLSDDLRNTIKKEKTYEEAVDLMKRIVESMSTSQIEHLQNLINSALETIFFDRQYSVDLVVTELRNTNNLQIILSETNEDGTVVKTKLADNGYGVKSIIGFILQVYFIIYHKEYPVLFLDEAFGTLSSQYVPYLKVLMDELAKKYGFIFVLITHDTRFMDVADKTYLVDKGKVTLRGSIYEN